MFAVTVNQCLSYKTRTPWHKSFRMNFMKCEFFVAVRRETAKTERRKVRVKSHNKGNSELVKTILNSFDRDRSFDTAITFGSWNSVETCNSCVYHLAVNKGRGECEIFYIWAPSKAYMQDGKILPLHLNIYKWLCQAVWSSKTR